LSRLTFASWGHDDAQQRLQVMIAPELGPSTHAFSLTSHFGVLDALICA
jgi:hypothetical protein